MSKKTAAADVDDLIDGADAPATAEAKPAKKAKAKPEAKPAAKGKAKPEAKPAAKGKAKPEAKPAAKGKAKAAEPSEGRSTAPIRQALMKVKKATSYADFAAANEFDIRSVRRTARVMRDAGQIELTKEGTVVYISPAV